jgi:hypothetical protein
VRTVGLTLQLKKEVAATKRTKELEEELSQSITAAQAQVCRKK